MALTKKAREFQSTSTENYQEIGEINVERQAFITLLDTYVHLLNGRDKVHEVQKHSYYYY